MLFSDFVALFLNGLFVGWSMHAYLHELVRKYDLALIVL